LKYLQFQEASYWTSRISFCLRWKDSTTCFFRGWFIWQGNDDVCIYSQRYL